MEKLIRSWILSDADACIVVAHGAADLAKAVKLDLVYDNDTVYYNRRLFIVTGKMPNVASRKQIATDDWHSVTVYDTTSEDYEEVYDYKQMVKRFGVSPHNPYGISLIHYTSAPDLEANVSLGRNMW